MTPKRCACCGKTFTPCAQVPGQTYCSAPGCQRARKRLWQRGKLQSDPEYRINQRAAQLAWARRNPHYWRDYHKARAGNERHNHNRRRARDHPESRPDGNFIKMDVCDLLSGLYQITRHPALPRESGQSWVVEITPASGTRPYKMDASREDLIDIASFSP
ncbi:hypothetical protein FACS1894101_1950 [Betaproteobacteria bacterium]|nr:hypothetical protein FACS1894101_1950 [Betaproteobacteria bacterium]